MGILIWLVVGGICGWLASLIMRTDGQQGIVLNIVVGIVGALLAGFIVTPLIGGAPITSGVISIQSVIVSLIGAIVRDGTAVSQLGFTPVRDMTMTRPDFVALSRRVLERLGPLSSSG